MVEGAAFYLLCHDDVALDPDAVHLMVEESVRSNAGVVSPKFVNWDDPNVLLHVGMSCDKTGAVVDRVLEGEVDHGQHDGVRDVFVAPGGCILVRADLFAELGGFDAGIVAMGEDLDLSWRSQVAGSRVVVAPDARVRHREAVAGGIEPLSAGAEPEARHPVTMQMLQRRHELRDRPQVLHVVPPAAGPAPGGACSPSAKSWWPSSPGTPSGCAPSPERGDGTWRTAAEIRVLRRELASRRLFPDSEVRRLQIRGSARLSMYLSRLSHQGLQVANAVAVGGRAPERRARRGRRPDRQRRPGLQRGRGLRRARRPGASGWARPVRPEGRRTPARHRAPADHRRGGRLGVVAFGTRELFFGSLPLVGQLAPLPTWSSTWHHFFSGWQSAGVGTTAPSSPAFGLLGVGGTVLFGAMGAVQRLVLLGCIPLGAWGVSRLMRPAVSDRARAVAVVCYLGVPLPYACTGHRPLGRSGGLCHLPLHRPGPGPGRRGGPLRGGAGSTLAHPARPARVAILGAWVAAASGFAPAVVPMVLVTALAWEVGALLAGQREGSGRVLLASLAGVGVALVLMAPWVLGTLLAGRASIGIFGLPIPASSAPGWGEVVRFAIGPAARSPLVWLLVAGAALPLALGRGIRLAWAARLWVTACASWTLALVTSRGDLGSVHTLGVGRAGAGGPGRRRLRGAGYLRFRERPGRPCLRLAPGGRRELAGLRRHRVDPRRGGGRRRPLGPPDAGDRRSARIPRPGSGCRGRPGSCGWAIRGRSRRAGGRSATGWPTRSTPEADPRHRAGAHPGRSGTRRPGRR